ncbi:hypothetical protein TEK04_16200 [Klenkia sp. LSe6-5]|uniref:Gram-positive cocci surface proteins LPxTG domain-containing protein n=1 Tax=Klenkia sesuvii TaxID=3103137 RepID=A0ABU8DWN9_9ACTN
MSARSRVRRPLQVGGLMLATAVLGAVTAPAASAMVDPAHPGAGTPVVASATQTLVVAPTPVSYLGTPDEPVQFRYGALQVSVAPEPDDAAAAAVDPSAADGTGMAGAVVVVTVTTVEEESMADYPLDPGDTATCTTGADGSCELTGAVQMVDEDGRLRLFPGMAFTVQQTGAPTSGRYALPPAGDDVLYGVVVGRPLVFAPTVTPPGEDDEGDVAAVQFHDPVRTAAGADPGTPAAGSPAAGTTAAATTGPAAPAADGTPGTGTAAPATADAPTLASTGADVGPLIAVGGGLLAAGGLGLALARRRSA